MVDMAHFSGLVAGGVHQNPVQHAHVVTSTTHKSLRGPRGGLILTNDEAMAKKINSAIFPGLQGGPLMHVIAAKAVARCEGRANVSFDDVKRVAKPALRHRLIRSFEGEAEGTTTDAVIDALLAAVGTRPASVEAERPRGAA